MIENKLTKKHIDNLKKLRDYMASLPEDYEHFNMGAYASKCGVEIPPLMAKPGCGTVCCLAGHGPAAGIRSYGEQKNDWYLYVNTKFTRGNKELWSYLFSTRWPNNIQHAIERLDMAIKYKGNVPLEVILAHEYRMGYGLSVL